MRLFFLFLVISVPAMAMSRQERKQRFEQRSQKLEAEKMVSAEPLNGFFLFGNIAGSNLLPFENDYSYERRGEVTSEALFTQRNALQYAWNAGIGWLFYGYAGLDVAYEYMNIPFSVFTHPKTSVSLEDIATQQGYGKVQLQLAISHAKLLLPRIFGQKNATVIPFIGGGLGYVNKNLVPICLYDQGTLLVQENTKRNIKGGLVYKVLTGWYFRLQKYLLMNIEFSYVNMGSIKTKRDFSRALKGIPSEEWRFSNPIKLDLSSCNINLGFTVVL